MYKKSLLFLSLILIASFAFLPQIGKADPDAFTLISPSSGASWMMGSTQTVSWTKDPTAGITHLKLTLLYDGAHIVTIADIDVPENQTSGSVSWTIPTEYNNGTMIQPASTYHVSTLATGDGFSHVYDSASFSITANPAFIPDLTITGFSVANIPSTNPEPISILKSDSGYHVAMTIKNTGNIRAMVEDAKAEVFVNNVLATYIYLHGGLSSIDTNETISVTTFIPATLNVVPLGNATIKIVISNVPSEVNTSNNTATRLYTVITPPPLTYGVKVINTPNISSSISVSRGMTNVSLADFKIKSTGSEGVKINRILFQINQLPLTSLNNIRIYNGNQSWAGHVSQGGDNWSALIFSEISTIIPVGQEAEFIIKADIPTTATIGSEIYLDYWHDYSSYSGATMGQYFLTENDRVKVTVGLRDNVNQTNNNSSITGSQATNVEIRSIKDQPLYNRLKGNILLKTEDKGKAYYVHPTNKKSYYLGRPSDAFTVMSEQGIGISNNDLKKIPIGVEQMAGADQDGDALSDLFEDAIGTNKNKSDSDNDGYSDRVEINTENNPNGSGKLPINRNFSNSQQGRILLQVEGKGEAWYLNPIDNKRYFLGRPHDAFYIMQNVGFGISNKDFNKLN